MPIIKVYITSFKITLPNFLLSIFLPSLRLAFIPVMNSKKSKITNDVKTRLVKPMYFSINIEKPLKKTLKTKAFLLRQKPKVLETKFLQLGKPNSLINISNDFNIN
jgi:hypothetical protein